MPSEPIPGLQARAKRRAVQGLTRVLQRVAGRAPVIVPEYDLHPRPRWGWGTPAAHAVAEILAAGDAGYEPAIDAMLELSAWAPSVARDPVPGSGAPSWENNYWGGMDAVALVSELRRRNPRTYMEIGSGHSTRFARRAIEDFGLGTRIVSVDPQPRAEIDALCDSVVRSPAEEAGPEAFDALEAGDMLLVDGSHMAYMNSDVAVLFVEVMPKLAPGVLLAIHDVFLPWDYPPTWERRLYSEQYLVAALLLGGAVGWAVRFPAWHVTRVSPLGERLDPLWDVVESRFGRFASSFWMERS
jgi:methyltransferase family protein